MGKGKFLPSLGGTCDPSKFNPPYIPNASDLAQTYKDNAAQEESEGMTMDDTAVKNALDASPAPRVTEDKLASVIVGETFAHRLTGTLTICVLTLVNGFTVVGQSACASPENYREDLGEHYAREDAKRKIWPLEAYLLRERLHVAATFETDAALDGMEMYVGMKALYARAMTRGEYNTFKGWAIPADENPDDLGQIVQYSDGYISWTPQAQFDAAYSAVGTVRPATGLAQSSDAYATGIVGANGPSLGSAMYLRQDALNHAIKVVRDNDPDIVLRAAEKFAAYIRGDAK